MHSSAHSTINNNMVAISHGQNQLTGASKEEFPRFQRNLRVLLNQLRCLDTDCGDKVRAFLGNPILPENYGKPRGKVTQVLLDSEAGEGLRAAGFQVGDILITGSDRRETVVSLRREQKRMALRSFLIRIPIDSAVSTEFYRT